MDCPVRRKSGMGRDYTSSLHVDSVASQCLLSAIRRRKMRQQCRSRFTSSELDSTCRHRVWTVLEGPADIATMLNAIAYPPPAVVHIDEHRLKEARTTYPDLRVMAQSSITDARF